jgi:hypothetical protein
MKNFYLYSSLIPFKILSTFTQSLFLTSLSLSLFLYRLSSSLSIFAIHFLFFSLFSAPCCLINGLRKSFFSSSSSHAFLNLSSRFPMTYSKTEYIYHYLTVIARNTAKIASLRKSSEKKDVLVDCYTIKYLINDLRGNESEW